MFCATLVSSVSLVDYKYFLYHDPKTILYRNLEFLTKGDSENETEIQGVSSN